MYRHSFEALTEDAGQLLTAGDTGIYTQRREALIKQMRQIEVSVHQWITVVKPVPQLKRAAALDQSSALYVLSCLPEDAIVVKQHDSSSIVIASEWTLAEARDSDFIRDKLKLKSHCL